MVHTQNAIALLEDDHERLRDLFEQLALTTERNGRARADLVRDLALELRAHAELEETLFYPAYREAVEDTDDRRTYFEAIEHHHVVHLLLPELERTRVTSEEFGAKAKVLSEILELHIQAVEGTMFPSARAVMAKETLAELGALLAQRRLVMLTAR
jgi:hypothetical protein